MEIQVIAFLALLLASEVMSQAAFGKTCPIIYDGRVPQSMTTADMVKSGGPYGNSWIKAYAQDVKFPRILPSMWDYPKKTKPIEFLINDQSFYSARQPKYKSSFISLNTPASAGQGITTFHVSIRNDPARPLNFSHQYQVAVHDQANDQTSQFNILLGTPYNHTVPDPQTVRVAGRFFSHTFFKTPFYFDMWHNFAITVGWTTNKITVYYSTNYSPLQKVAGPVSYDTSGGGFYLMGPFKFPTGGKNIDIPTQGYQEPNLNEGLIYGGVFIEDSSSGCVSTWTQPY